MCAVGANLPDGCSGDWSRGKATCFSYFFFRDLFVEDFIPGRFSCSALWYPDQRPDSGEHETDSS